MEKTKSFKTSLLTRVDGQGVEGVDTMSVGEDQRADGTRYG
jgi:hypothetical protein